MTSMFFHFRGNFFILAESPYFFISRAFVLYNFKYFFSSLCVLYLLYISLQPLLFICFRFYIKRIHIFLYNFENSVSFYIFLYIFLKLPSFYKNRFYIKRRIFFYIILLIFLKLPSFYKKPLLYKKKIVILYHFI